MLSGTTAASTRPFGPLATYLTVLGVIQSTRAPQLAGTSARSRTSTMTVIETEAATPSRASSEAAPSPGW